MTVLAAHLGALQYVFVGLAGFAAGAVNALAGGGTLISFPVLIALGLPAVSANVTNTVALSPGYLGGVLSQKAALASQRDRIKRLTLGAVAGGLLGSVLLVLTSDDAFKKLIPILLVVATLLLATQDKIRVLLRIGQPANLAAGAERAATEAAATETMDGPGADPAGAIAHAAEELVHHHAAAVGPDSKPIALADPAWVIAPILVVSIYGGYFGAGLGIMLLAVLGIVLHDTLPRLNALKQVFAFAINGTAALFFLTSGKVYWVVALVMALASLAGGNLGGRLAGSVKPARLRTIVVAIGLVAAVAYAVKYWS